MDDDKPLIIFDFDGALIYLKEEHHYIGRQSQNPDYISLRERVVIEAKKLGVPEEIYKTVEERMAARWNATLQYLFDSDSSEKRILEVMSVVNEPILRHEIEEHENSEIFDDTVDTLKTLKEAGYRIVIATNTSESELLRMMKDKFGFGHYVDGYVSRVLTDYLKPHPNRVIKILKEFNAKEAIYVGDADHDKFAFDEACKTLGVNGTFILLNSRNYDKPTIELLEPDAIIDSPGGLLPILKI